MRLRLPVFALALGATLGVAHASESRFRFLPLYEHRFDGTNSFVAVRPFFSAFRDARQSGVSSVDVLWPMATFHASGNLSWWRALNCGGARRSPVGGAGVADRSFYFFPFWFHGVDRNGSPYAGLFPLWGRHPHFALMDDIDFAMWPVWMEYSVKGVRSHSLFWPFVSWRDEPRESFGIWPFFGYSTQRESRHGYFVWPFFTHARYFADRDTAGAGNAWMFFPFCGFVNRERERQYLALPPFFSYAHAGPTRRWRMPWPLVDVELGAVRNRVSVWPLWESIEAFPYPGLDGAAAPAEERTWRIGWKLVERTRLSSGRTEERRFSLFPFWTAEDGFSRERANGGALKRKRSYRRLWPFFAYAEEDGQSQLKVLELNPIRHSEGIERNWAPFWTFYTCEGRPDGRKLHTFFWGLVKFSTGGDSQP